MTNTNTYEILVAGTVIAVASTKEEAEEKLYFAKHSFLAMVHPVDVFCIRENK